MTDYSKTARTLIYLLSCAVSEKECELKSDEIDFDGLYSLAKRHSLCSAAAFALESAGINEPRFTQAKVKAKRKLALFDIERVKIYQKLNDAGIWFAPLKGIVLKDSYPRYGMREMSDNDILCDSSKMAEVREIMESLGFICSNYGEWHHDNYQKPPTLDFEMHHTLFQTDDSPAFQHNGTGLRSLLDIHVYLQPHPDLDFDYIDRELEKLQLLDFAQRARGLAVKLFGLQKLSEEDLELLPMFLDSSLYGSVEQGEYNHLTRQLDGKDSKRVKIKYFFDRIFLHGESLERSYPFFARHKWLLPALYVYRLFKSLFTRPKGILRETKNVVKYHSPKKRW